MKRISFLIVLIAAMILLAGCTNPLTGTADNGSGSIIVSISESVSRTLVPDISMTPASYVLTGSGPADAVFTQTITGQTSAVIPGLAPGDWSVSVEAKNADGIFIGAGTGTTIVSTEVPVVLDIAVMPYSGTGTLALGFTWIYADIAAPAIEASLVSVGTGSTRSLNFVMESDIANFTATDIATGYYTLILKFMDTGNYVAGAVEAVRIVKNQTSVGNFSFDKLARMTGTLTVNVTPEMADPLIVSITGASASKPVNAALSLSAATGNCPDPVVYTWYVNGNAAGTGASLAFGSTYAIGHYRIDVTAATADGLRAGSGSVQVEVIAAPDPGTVIDGVAVNLSTDALTPGRIIPEGISYPVSSITSDSVFCTNTVSGFAAGDRVILINLQGSASQTANVGTYEILTIQSVNNNQMIFTSPVAGIYGQSGNPDLGGQKVIVQRVPVFDSLTLTNNAGITVNSWNGTSGGLLVIEALNAITITNNSAITVDGKGFRGGVAQDLPNTGFQGESISGTGSNLSSNNLGGGGGGGATDHGAEGGGGGGYGMAGENGFVPYALGSGTVGIGGIQYGLPDNKLFSGSGGGSSGHATYEYTLAPGGSGGGIILLITPSLVMSAGGKVSAKGNNGGIKSWRGGGGGGGSGGTILIITSEPAPSLDMVDVSGGLHVGDNEGASFPNGKYGGRGGDGGAGRKYLKIDN